jgi:hypothetical protein
LKDQQKLTLHFFDHSHPQASHIGVDLALILVLLLEVGLRTIFQRDVLGVENQMESPNTRFQNECMKVAKK